ncbi:rhomboid family intramembrane serine protease [Roseivirga sp.]|uniref:rhomboid family intramembrane serine protease n=1 Tax=Roseivirga sp. TaxID=1964215 RepID=UPI003B518926
MNSFLDDFKLAFRTGNILNQIIIINVVIFLAFAVVNVFFTFAGEGKTFALISRYLMLPAHPDNLISQPWTIITYFFFHKGFFHILWNMLFMYWFGRIISEYLGQNKLLGLYVWGGIGGGILYILAYNLMPYFENQVASSYLLGASGGVVAIVVGAATFQPNFSVHLLLLGPVKLKYIAAFTVFVSFIQSTGTNAGGEIAHLGGALVGFLMIKQLQQGNDWSKPVVSFVLWIKSLFKPQPKIKVSYKKAKTSSSRSTGKAKAKSSAQSKTAQDEIDTILDKISEKGYDALSKEEKQKLFNASKD